MSTFSLRLPDSLHDELRRLAKKEGISINQFVASAVTEKISAFRTSGSLGERATRGNRRDFEKVLSKIPDKMPSDIDRIPTLNNKWRWGSLQFKLPQMPPELLASSGIFPISLVVDGNAGREVVLLIVEPMDKLEEFKGRGTTEFVVKTGLVRTSFGPIGWFLFYFSDPGTGSRVVYERVVNPKEPDQLLIYECLAAQKYWHVILADDTGEVVNFFEFENDYGLSDAVRQMETVSSDMRVSDFNAAKSEYEDTYSIDDLLAFGPDDVRIRAVRMARTG